MGDSISQFAGDAKDAVGDGLSNLGAGISEAINATAGGYVLDATNQWGWITLYVVTIVIAILGNLLFIVASLCTKRTRTTGEEKNDWG